MLTVSFLGSRSRSRRSREVLTFRASDRAIRPPVFISFSLRSRRISLGLSAMNSATATAPTAQNDRREPQSEMLNSSLKKQQKRKHTIYTLAHTHSHLHRTVWLKQDLVWVQSDWQSVHLSACELPRFRLNCGRGSKSPDSGCMAERNNIEIHFQQHGTEHFLHNGTKSYIHQMPLIRACQNSVSWCLSIATSKRLCNETEDSTTTNQKKSCDGMKKIKPSNSLQKLLTKRHFQWHFQREFYLKYICTYI